MLRTTGFNLRHIFKISQLFSRLDDRALDELEQASSLKNAPKGELLFYEGDPAHSFFVVGRGKVKVFKLSPDGKEQILLIAGPGDSFAEAAMFTGGKFPASAQVLEEAELLVINRDKFVSVLERNPGIALNLIAEFSVLLHKLARLVGELSLTDVTTRLACYLLDRIEEKSASSEPITLTLSDKKTVLASLLGTIPETLSRSFQKLTRDGIITVDGAKIRILDRNRLREMAGE